MHGSLCRPLHPRIWALEGPLSGHQILDVAPKPTPISGPPQCLPTSSHYLFPLTSASSLASLPPILSLPIHSPQRAPKTRSGSLLSTFSQLSRLPLPGSAKKSSPLTSRLGRGPAGPAAAQKPPLELSPARSRVHFPSWTVSPGRTGPGLSRSSLCPQPEQVRALMRERETVNE